MKIIENQNFQQERALYALTNAKVNNCRFEGEEDGESPLKETYDIQVNNSFFALRYPFWHNRNTTLNNVKMTELCRAALWYDQDVKINHSVLHGIKALRECQDIVINHSDIISPEFGWFCNDLKINDTSLVGEYPFLHSSNMVLSNFKLQGKYSFQYVKDLIIRDSYLDTKDAFWHSQNVTVYDSVIKGEYLAWYSEGLKLVRCKIIGTQPLCYASNLILEDCEMVDTDLAFEYSEVNATIKGNIDSIKNPKTGKIVADHIGEVILDENIAPESDCEIITQ